MIQYNYLDEHNQAGKSGLKYAASKNIPVMIMEPLRGGRLVENMPKEVYKTFDQAHVKRSPAEWAFRWLWNQPEVTVVLSGMNSSEMVAENIATASDAEPDTFTEEDEQLFEKVRKILRDSIRVPCTGCNYCMPCPKGVDIPGCFACYNNVEVEGKMWGIMKYMMQTAMDRQLHNASQCVQCGKCEQHCPQSIEIRKELGNVSKELDGVIFKVSRVFIKAFMLRGNDKAKN